MARIIAAVANGPACRWRNVAAVPVERCLVSFRAKSRNPLPTERSSGRGSLDFARDDTFGKIPHVPFDLKTLHPVDETGHLYISPVIHDWDIVTSYGIDTVLDMEGG